MESEQFGGCGIGAGFGYGWFIAGLGVPIRRMKDELGITEKRIWQRYEQHERDRANAKGKAKLTGPSVGSGTQMHGADGGRMPCEQVEDEDTILDERLKEVIISIERRRQDIQQRREALLKLMQQHVHTK